MQVAIAGGAAAVFNQRPGGVTVNFHEIVIEVLTQWCDRGLDVDVGLNRLGDDDGGVWQRSEVEALVESALAAAFDLAAGGHLSVTSECSDANEARLGLEISGRDRVSHERIMARAAATGRTREMGPHVAVRLARGKSG